MNEQANDLKVKILESTVAVKIKEKKDDLIKVVEEQFGSHISDQTAGNLQLVGKHTEGHLSIPSLFECNLIL